MLELTDRAEEILEQLWTSIKEKNLSVVLVTSLTAELQAKEVVDELVSSKLMILTGDTLQLTPAGEKKAENVVRRHRLAERLLTDVLDVKGRMIHDSACQFEHLLHEGLDENICILLGHPRTCPHGKKIPMGKCCLEKEKSVISKIVSSLSTLVPGQQGKIAYIQASDQQKLQKMMAMGVIPGQSITLLQGFPSYLFKVGNSQFAVDKQIADEIYVRIGK
jgi:DtxR family Mn-dependent transcriptional regulator